MFPDDIGKNSIEQTPKNIPPRSFSTPFNYHQHSTSGNNSNITRNQIESTPKQNPSFLDKLTPEELSLLCEIENDEPTEYEAKIQGFIQEQKELNAEACTVIDKFTESLKVSKDFIPHFKEATDNYSKAFEIQASLEVISQFHNIDTSAMTPFNQELLQ